MPARKKSVIETSPSDSSSKTKTVAAKHTITYEAPVDVPVTDLEMEEPEEAEDGIVEIGETEDQSRYRPPSFRAKLKEKFQRKGIGGDETLNLRIDRLPLFDLNGYAGVKAEKEFCGIIQCTEKFFDNDEYLIETQRRYGPGEYWLTVRHKNLTVNAWRERVGGFPSPQVTAPVVSENGQITPQIIYQTAPSQPQQPVAVQDPLAQMRNAFKLVREFKTDLGLDFSPQQQQQPQPLPAPLDPKIAALQLITENPDVMERIGKGIANTVLGKDAHVADDWPSVIKEVALEAIKSGQAPQILGSLIREVMAPFTTAFTGGQNGQAQMAPQTVSQSAGLHHQWSESLQNNQAQIQQESPTSEPTQHRGGLPTVGERTGRDSQSAISPEEQVLALALDHCARQIPPQIAAQRIIQIADAINEGAPGMSIDGYLLLFTQLTPQAALEMAIQITPDAGQVVTLAHAEKWTSELQALLKAQIGEEYANEETGNN